MFCGVLVIYNWLLALKIIKIYTFSVPVVSVGNLTVGGDGKTPFVYYLAKLLTQSHIRHVVVSRGYKKTAPGTCVVHDGIKKLIGSPEHCGDEPFMLACKLDKTPIVVDNKKTRGLEYAIQQFNPKIVLLDDGFQSHYIAKNLEIVLFNTLNTKRDLKIFPFGKLRENIRSLQRADLVVFTKTNLKKEENTGVDSVMPLIKSNKIPYIYSEITTSLIKNSLNSIEPLQWNSTTLTTIPTEHKLVSFCGIGDPNSFDQTTMPYQDQIVEYMVLQDHYNYYKNEDKLLKICQGLYVKFQFTGLLTTQKDFVKIKNLSGPFLLWCYHTKISFFILDIDMELPDNNFILEKIKSLIL